MIERPLHVVASRALWPKADGAPVRDIPEETALALVIDGGTEAVMMGSPGDLQDFAYGFALNEGLIASLGQVRSFEVTEAGEGLELRLWLVEARRRDLAARRRFRVGPTGCGLCGVDSIAEALRPLPCIESQVHTSAARIIDAMEALEGLQPLNARVRAVHAAAFLDLQADRALIVREDVGRHNALDKLAGALASESISAASGAILMTSRLSVELIQKTAMMGAPIIAAISAPTGQALRTAERAGICVAGIVRRDGLEVFSVPERLRLDAAS
jgi:FdhD protein